jgi:hypothetical protein
LNSNPFRTWTTANTFKMVLNDFENSISFFRQFIDKFKNQIQIELNCTKNSHLFPFLLRPVKTLSHSINYTNLFLSWTKFIPTYISQHKLLFKSLLNFTNQSNHLFILEHPEVPHTHFRKYFKSIYVHTNIRVYELHSIFRGNFYLQHVTRNFKLTDNPIYC